MYRTHLHECVVYFYLIFFIIEHIIQSHDSAIKFVLFSAPLPAKMFCMKWRTVYNYRNVLIARSGRIFAPQSYQGMNIEFSVEMLQKSIRGT